MAYIMLLEPEIISYIAGEFSPESILLGGSRSIGQERPDSDWDLYLIGDYPHVNQRVARFYDGSHLDIALFPKISLEDNVLRIYYGPVKGLKVVVDNDAGGGQRIVDATEKAYLLGPEPTSDERRIELFEDASRILSKITGYAAIPAVVTFHLSAFYQQIFPLWFALRDMWSLPVHEAIPIIEMEDPMFSRLLEQFSNGSTAKKVSISHEILEHLFCGKNSKATDDAYSRS